MPFRQSIQRPFPNVARGLGIALGHTLPALPAWARIRQRHVATGADPRVLGVRVAGVPRVRITSGPRLLSYGADLADLLARSATMADKILKGAKPGDLPIEQPTKFDLIVNRSAAKALGVTVPPSLLARAELI